MQMISSPSISDNCWISPNGLKRNKAIPSYIFQINPQQIDSIAKNGHNKNGIQTQPPTLQSLRLFNMENENDGASESIRFIWNVTPSTRVQQARAVIHPAFHYTPLAEIIQQPLNYTPLQCKCQAYFNRYCPINFQAKTISCCICGNTMGLPANYANYIRPETLPFQLMPRAATFEFQNQNNQPHTPAYLFVVDLCVNQKELASVQEEIIKAINLLPDNARVGLMAFNKFVHVYELASKINTVYCVNGVKEYSVKQIIEILGINIGSDPRMQTQDIPKRFLVPLKEFRERIIRRIHDMKVDGFIYVSERPLRVTGQAINVAMTIAQVSPIIPRIVVMIGGPCTGGPGQVIDQNYKQQMRSAEQLSKGQNVPFFQKAKKFYESLSQKALSKRIIVDIFAFCVEEIGIMEMGDLLSASGGFLVMQEEFKQRIFKESFQKYFSEHKSLEEDEEESRLILSTEGTVFVYASKEVSINGALGQCHPLGKIKPFVSDKVMGKGKTHVWYLGSLDQEKTITILYESKQQKVEKEIFFIQMKTIRKNSEGKFTTRITTVKRLWGDNVQQIAYGFDQQAAAVYLARMCMHKAIIQEQKHLRQWLDNSLCRWASYFANYIKNDRSSFNLPPAMKQMPQLIYHLRRSHLVNRFGCSLDESYYFMSLLGRESVSNTLAMIQPILLKYSLEQLGPDTVALDQEEMQDDVILLLDSYFTVIEWYGASVQSWYEENYQERQGFGHIAQLFESPKQDVNEIIGTRFPAPNYYLTCPGHSKERYLKSRVNPKKSLDMQNENTVTDDSDIKAFTEHLIKVVVSQSTP